jgi:cytochrome c oxidase cbb3-type subunit III
MLWLAGAALLQAQGSNPHTSAADVARGKELFGGHCGGCHGPMGEGGRGPVLARPTLARAANDAQLFTVIKDGLPGTEMPRGSALDEKELWQVTAFVRALGKVAPEKVAGDAANGRRVYQSKGGCARCHQVGGEGGGLGPALTQAGSRRSATFLRQTLLDPASTTPFDYQMVDVTTKAGKRVSGVLLAEDTFTLQMRDFSEKPLSFWKHELTDVQRAKRKTPMPSYRGTLTAGEIEDVVAYLLTLRGEQ